MADNNNKMMACLTVNDDTIIRVYSRTGTNAVIQYSKQLSNYICECAQIGLSEFCQVNSYRDVAGPILNPVPVRIHKSNEKDIARVRPSIQKIQIN